MSVVADIAIHILQVRNLISKQCLEPTSLPSHIIGAVTEIGHQIDSIDDIEAFGTIMLHQAFASLFAKVGNNVGEHFKVVVGNSFINIHAERRSTHTFKYLLFNDWCKTVGQLVSCCFSRHIKILARTFGSFAMNLANSINGRLFSAIYDTTNASVCATRSWKLAILGSWGSTLLEHRASLWMLGAAP